MSKEIKNHITNTAVMDESPNKVTMYIQRKVYYAFTAKKTFEKNNGISLTEPDKAMTMEELFKRFASGQPLNVQLESLFHGGDDTEVSDDYLEGVNFQSLDISEKHELLKNIDLDLSKLKKGIKDRRELEISRKNQLKSEFDQRQKELADFLENNKKVPKLV